MQQPLKPASLNRSPSPDSPSLTLTAARCLTQNKTDEPTGPFPNTVWSRDDLPAPGYTGVLKPTLREPPRTVRPNDEERRRELHAAAVQPLVDSLLLTGMSSDLQHNTNTTSRNNTLDNKSAHAKLATAAEVASRGTATLGADSSSVTQSEKEARVAAWAPYDVQGAPPLPAQPGGKAAVAGARAAHAASAGAEAQHKPLKRPVTEHAARRGEIPWRWGNPAGDPDCAWGSANGNLTTWSGDSSNLATRYVYVHPDCAWGGGGGQREGVATWPGGSSGLGARCVCVCVYDHMARELCTAAKGRYETSGLMCACICVFMCV